MFTVEDLIALLEKQDKKMPIMIEDYGGHLRSPIVIDKVLDKNGNIVLVLSSLMIS